MGASKAPGIPLRLPSPLCGCGFVYGYDSAPFLSSTLAGLKFFSARNTFIIKGNRRTVSSNIKDDKNINSLLLSVMQEDLHHHHLHHQRRFRLRLGHARRCCLQHFQLNYQPRPQRCSALTDRHHQQFKKPLHIRLKRPSKALINNHKFWLTWHVPIVFNAGCH